MPFEHVPQDRFILNSLSKMIATSAGEAEEQRSYDTAIGFGIEEFIRHSMRQLAQERIGAWDDDDLLDAAVHQCAAQLQREIDSKRLRFDLARYLDHARDSLKA